MTDDDGFWTEPPDEAPGTPDAAATDTAAVPTQRDHAADGQADERSDGAVEEAVPDTATVPEARTRDTEEDAAGVAETAESPSAEPETAEPEGSEPDTAEDPLLPALDPALLKPQLEAVLMVVENPVPDVVLAQVLEQPTEAVLSALRELSAEYTAQNRGFDLRQVAGGWRFYTRPEHAEAVEKFVLDGQQSKLTQAALETLAVVAYRQPVSRSRISAVRGVNCDGVMRTLLARGLVEEYGTEPETGAYLYRTTDFFLERMGLVGLDELPELAPFLPEVEALEAETEGALEGLPMRSAGTPREQADDGAPETGDTGAEDPAAADAEAADAEGGADGAPEDADAVPAADDPTETGRDDVPEEPPGAVGEAGRTTTSTDD